MDGAAIIIDLFIPPRERGNGVRLRQALHASIVAVFRSSRHVESQIEESESMRGHAAPGVT
jgi:hypothetical protein